MACAVYLRHCEASHLYGHTISCAAPASRMAPQATWIDPAMNLDAAIEFADCMALLDAASIRF